MSEPLIRAFRPDDAGWITDTHQTYYRAAEGFDDTFGPLVARILADFLASHDPQREAGWVAERDGERVGCIFCVAQTTTCAKLRLFYMAPVARGTGLAQRVLQTCLDHAKAAGFDDMQLWTHESHAAAGRIYARNGFALIDSKPVHSFGVDLVEQTWAKSL